NDPARPATYTLSLHDALPISERCIARRILTEIGLERVHRLLHDRPAEAAFVQAGPAGLGRLRNRLAALFQENQEHAIGLAEFLRSEEHTSELQSQSKLVCRLL